MLFLVQNATHLYDELDSIFDLSNDKEAKRVQFNAPTLPHPKLKNLAPRTCGQICEFCLKDSQHSSKTCYLKNPRNMYLFPPPNGYNNGIIPKAMLNLFRRKSDRDITRGNILRKSKYISGYELHTSSRWQCHWLYEIHIPIPSEVFQQYNNLYSSKVTIDTYSNA
jgi:hypothetical protein